MKALARSIRTPVILLPYGHGGIPSSQWYRSHLVVWNPSRLQSTEPKSRAEYGSSSSKPMDSATSKMRGRRRKNYADEDEVLRLEHQAQTSTVLESESCAISSSPFADSYAATNDASDFFRGNLSVATRSTGPGWLSRLLLRSLWTPQAGFVVSKILECAAFGFYLSGKLSFYYRHSPEGRNSERSTSKTELPLPNLSASLYVGCSPIHGRGIFTKVALPRGTRLPLSLSVTNGTSSAPRCIIPGHTHMLLFSDTYEKLPDTLHYTHPTGRLLEVMVSRGAVSSASAAPIERRERSTGSHQSFSHVLLNHSCAANVCSGLSPLFWPAALAADQQTGTRVWQERIGEFDGFYDPNAFFLSRDVAAGEELTLDYGCRIAPLYATSNTRYSFFFGKYSRLMAQNQSCATAACSPLPLTLCRCNSPSCRRYLYQPPPERPAARSGSSAWKDNGGNNAMASGHHKDFQIATDLFARNYDDECTILSLLSSPEPLFAYLSGKPIPSLINTTQEINSNKNDPQPIHVNHFKQSAHMTPVMTMERYKKSTFIQAYRQLFTVLNAIHPQN